MKSSEIIVAAHEQDIRCIISHEYFDVDYKIIWKTIKQELPALHKQLKKLLDSY